MDQKEQVYELQRLKATLKEIELQLASGNASCSAYQTELRNTLDSYWENVGRSAADEAQSVELVERQRDIVALAGQKVRQLNKMLHSPYFGRIDFLESLPQASERPEQIYIGIATLSDHLTCELLVYDWRTPVAGMFYDFERGSAWYACPEGTVHGTVTLKRQYKIADRQMKYMFESDLKIDDEILQELLGKSADNKMRAIVTSIQREQNQAIRDAGHRLVFVRGPAGSGKTSIALHRVAYLLYRDRETLNAKNVLILSPNHIFSDYIANVLPEIGEENVLQTTFQDYITWPELYPGIRVESRIDQLEYLLSRSETTEHCIRIAGIRYKSSTGFEQIIGNFLDFIQEQLVLDYPAIEYRGQVIFSRKDWRHYYFDSLDFLPAARRLAKIRELIQLRLRPLVRETRREKAAAITATAEEVNEKTIKALARISAKREFDSLRTEIDRLTTLDPRALYREIFENENLYRRLAAGTPVPEQWTEIAGETLRLLENGILPYEDSMPFFYFQGVLEGFPVQREIKHIVIDEAQDYTAIQYKILAQIFPNCSWTVLGDPAQAIHPYLETADFADASRIITNDKATIFQLTRSYRSTREIQAFCRALLVKTNPVESMNRSGPLPRITRIETAHSLAAALASKIRASQEEAWRSIAVICKTACACSQIYNALKSHIKLTLITSENDAFSQGVVVIPTYLAKGLEFDSVFIPDADAESYGCEEERGILYIACTRALHRLTLLYKGQLSPFVRCIEPALYKIS